MAQKIGAAVLKNTASNGFFVSRDSNVTFTLEGTLTASSTVQISKDDVAANYVSLAFDGATSTLAAIDPSAAGIWKRWLQGGRWYRLFVTNENTPSIDMYVSGDAVTVPSEL